MSSLGETSESTRSVRPARISLFMRFFVPIFSANDAIEVRRSRGDRSARVVSRGWRSVGPRASDNCEYSPIMAAIRPCGCRPFTVRNDGFRAGLASLRTRPS